MEIVNTVLQQMSSLNKPQWQFIFVLLPLLMCLRGRVNLRNLSRYSDHHEKTFSRWYRCDFDFNELNRLSLQSLHEETADTPRWWESSTATAQASLKRSWKYRR